MAHKQQQEIILKPLRIAPHPLATSHAINAKRGRTEMEANSNAIGPCPKRPSEPENEKNDRQLTRKITIRREDIDQVILWHMRED